MSVTRQEFDAAVERREATEGIRDDACIYALFHDALDAWDAAHDCVQDFDTSHRAASWIHGYLHRKEGDLRNAAFWYRYIGRELPTESLAQEREELLSSLLSS